MFLGDDRIHGLGAKFFGPTVWGGWLAAPLIGAGIGLLCCPTNDRSLTTRLGMSLLTALAGNRVVWSCGEVVRAPVTDSESICCGVVIQAIVRTFVGLGLNGFLFVF